MISPYLTFISEEIPSLFFEPKSIDAVFAIIDQGSSIQRIKFIVKLLLNLVDILARK